MPRSSLDLNVVVGKADQQAFELAASYRIKGEFDMFWAIFLTLIISCLVFLVLVFRRGYLDEKAECRNLRNINGTLRKKLDDCREFETNRRVHTAYEKGLYDGRETDRAYRELLKKYRDGDYDERIYNGMRGGK